MFRIYNDWLVDFCRYHPDRYIGLACLPYGDIDAAVKEIYRVAKLGLRGMELSCSWDMEPMWHPVWEPLWKAVNDVALPLHFHTFPSLPPASWISRRAHAPGGVLHRRLRLSDEPRQHPRRGHRAAVLERYPNIRIAFGESGIAGCPMPSTAWTSSGGPLPRPRSHDEAE